MNTVALTDAAPRLSALLPPRTLGAAMERAGLGHVGHVRVARVHFSDRRPTVIECRIGDGTTTVLAEVVGSDAPAHARDECTRLTKSRRGQVAKGGAAPILLDEPTGLVFRPLGLDARLPGLRLLHDRDAARAFTVRAGHRDDLVNVRLMAHRLGKRAVLRFGMSDGETIFVRLVPATGDRAAKAFERHGKIAEALAGHPDIDVPRPLTLDADLGAAAYSALPGHPPELDDAHGSREIQVLTKALKALITVPADELALHGPAEELALLAAWVDRIATLCPELGDLARQTLEDLRQRFAAMGEAPAGFCHRDLHERQILIGPERAGLLDFDTCCRADQLLDAGNLMAHLYLLGLRRGRPTVALERSVAERLGAAADGALRLDLWRRASLLRLACLYAPTSEPEAIVRNLLEEAAA